MRESKFSYDDVLCFLEDTIISGLATDREQEAYEDMKWFNKMNKNTYNQIVRKMTLAWNEKF